MDIQALDAVLPILLVVFLVIIVASLLPARSRAIAAAGTAQFQMIRPRMRFWRRVGTAVWGCVAVLMLVVLVAGIVSGDETRRLVRSGSLLVWAVVILLLRAFGPDTSVTEIREKGIVVDGVEFHPWNDLTSWRWEGGVFPLLILRFRNCVRQNRIAPEQRPAVDSLLQQGTRKGEKGPGAGPRPRRAEPDAAADGGRDLGS